MGRTREYIAASLIVAACGVGTAGCRERSSENARTQGALGAAVRRVQGPELTGSPVATIDPPPAAAAAIMPEVAVVGAGEGARASVQADLDHINPEIVRTSQGWALTWGDRERSRVFFGRTDPNGHAVDAPTMLRQAVADEEDAQGASVVTAGTEFGVAWADPANGRVRFARVDATGRVVGIPAIVHDGLEMPRATRLAWNGDEFGVAVALDQGVYFARISREGRRVGQGVLVTEGTRVGSLESVSPAASGFQIVWREGGIERRTTIGSDGVPRPAGAVRSASDRRVASR